MGVRGFPKRLQSQDSQFTIVHRHSPQFISTAEVIAEVDPLCHVQGVECAVLQRDAKSARSLMVIIFL